MKFSTQEEFGLRLLLRIAKSDSSPGLTIPEISELEGISIANAGKILRILRLAGFIESARGQTGGYNLKKPANEIIGKQNDYIVTPDGRYLGNVLEHSVDNAKGVMQSQCVQDSVDGIYVNLVVDDSFNDDSIKALEEGLRKRLGDEIRIHFKQVDVLDLRTWLVCVSNRGDKPQWHNSRTLQKLTPAKLP